MSIKYCEILLIIVFISVVLQTSATPVISDTITIPSNSVEHVYFDVKKNLTVVLDGISDQTVDLLVLDSGNYSLWVDQFNYSYLLSERINTDKFSFEININFINDTIHILFLNIFDYNITLSYNINITALNSAYLYFPPFLFAFLIPVLVRKYSRSRGQ